MTRDAFVFVDVLGETEIRRLFTIYLLSLLTVANNPSE